ncbi:MULTISPECIES: helix-turn-helix domain-containing protein [unclassified Fusibacter]|uniref:helix-turn-helix domain-containing protein n=1 Tax=unclassified Fusibacter TaxID=2624464 RepID=UPI001010745B|nr:MULTISPECIES: helix-turn-helix domain-containing protein [unclassified Fusibacter]MCK8060738.1 helix-turn-helix domain-containing protein [Fusibacter sp. A2]NPE23034.1 helix-turn-helix domain containing protein [Fusibacter sp. A1]RXV59707.1 helix-turn-helix domain-containing protein [Fusibacter sp. A1]
MLKDQKYKIISEGLKNGISPTCKKYAISRTIYYRWLTRFKEDGIDGLNDKKKSFIPLNKTSASIEEKLFRLVKTYPHYGPRALKYLLDELGCKISESAVYNILKRHALTRKENRIKYAKKYQADHKSQLPDLNSLTSGECWIFWITDYGYTPNYGHLYLYNLIDIKSHIACSRIYSKVSYKHFEDLLTAVALSVATSLNMPIAYLCFFEDRKLLKKSDQVSRLKLSNTLKEHGFDPTLHFLSDDDHVELFHELRQNYSSVNSEFVMPFIKSAQALSHVKISFQHHIRNYNLNIKKQYSEGLLSPIEYHNLSTNTQTILPIWAYMDRNY